MDGANIDLRVEPSPFTGNLHRVEQDSELFQAVSQAIDNSIVPLQPPMNIIDVYNVQVPEKGKCFKHQDGRGVRKSQLFQFL